MESEIQLEFATIHKDNLAIAEAIGDEAARRPVLLGVVAVERVRRELQAETRETLRRAKEVQRYETCGGATVLRIHSRVCSPITFLIGTDT